MELKKTLLFICLIASLQYSLIAEDTDRSKEIKKEMWVSSDPAFKSTEIPEKWKDRSAVILAREYKQGYQKQAIVSYLYYNSSSHIRVKIMAQNALEDYAQFSLFRSGENSRYSIKYYAGYKIIKPDGREIEIPLSNAVEEEGKINSYGFKTLKLAIPNLEIGDILDYYNVEERTILTYAKLFSFDPTIFQLSASYPIVEQTIAFKIARRCFLNLKSLNGAPAFRLKKGEDEDLYVLKDKDREGIDRPRWFYDNRALPTVKYRVTYASPLASQSADYFLGQPRVLKSKVSKDEMLLFMRHKYVVSLAYSASFYGYVRSKVDKKSPRKMLVNGLYNGLRKYIRIDNAEKWLLDGDVQDPEPKEEIPVCMMAYALAKYKIPHKVFISVPRSISNMDNLIIKDELSMGIEVIIEGKPVYINQFYNNSSLGTINSNLEGTKIYYTNNDGASGKWQLAQKKLRISSHQENYTSTKTTLTIDDFTTEDLSLIIEKTIGGHQKRYYQSMFIDYYDLLPEEKKNYDDIAPLGEKYPRKIREKYAQKRNDYLASKDEKREKLLTDMFEVDYDFEIKGVEDFKLHELGRDYLSSPKMNFSCKVDISGILKKVGKKYLLDVGKLIESQVELKKSELTRDYDIYMPYTRSFSHDITIKIPDGYTVEGLDKLKYNVVNEFGGFVTSFAFEDGVLNIKTKKYYTQQFMPKDAWGQVVDYLKGAEEFGKQSILLSME